MEKFINENNKSSSDASEALLGNAPDKQKEDLQTRLDRQSQGEKEPGLDPIIAKGSSLIKDLDAAVKANPYDQDYVNMRVEAGINQVNAYANCRTPGGKDCAMKSEATQELKNVLSHNPRMHSDQTFQHLAKLSQADSDESFSKAIMQAKVDVHKQSEGPFGLDPIRVKGRAVIRELDELLKTAPNDKDYRAMRIEAGMTQTSAYVHSRRAGSEQTRYPEEALAELTKIMSLDPNMAKNRDFQTFVKLAEATSNPEFKRNYERNGGK